MPEWSKGWWRALVSACATLILGIYASAWPASVSGQPPGVSGTELVYLSQEGIRIREVSTDTDRRVAPMSALGQLGACVGYGGQQDQILDHAYLSISPDGRWVLVRLPEPGADCWP